MKIKKLLIVISMLAVMFSLSACGDKAEKPFDYNDQQIVLDTMRYFYEYSTMNSELADYYLQSGSEFEQSAIKGIRQAQDTDKVGAFEDYTDYNQAIEAGTFNIKDVDAEITNSADSVTVKIINKSQNRDVEVTVKYTSNPDYYIQVDKLVDETYKSFIQDNMTSEEMMMVLAQEGCSSLSQFAEIKLQLKGQYSYMPEEMVVSAVYSKSELMGQAGMNTLLGMGTVFVVLIFISFIISLFKFLPALLAKKPKLPEAKEEKAPVAAAPKASAPAKTADNLMNDKELVAVITAAVYAAAGSSGAVSKDRLVVRSIKRARK